MLARRFTMTLAVSIAALAVGVPLAGAGNQIVDDYWRDGAAVASPTANTMVDDYWRDRAAVASPTSSTIVDDYFRDRAAVASPSANTIVDDYFRTAPAVVTSGDGFHWADFGIGIGVAVGAVLLLAGLGAGVLATRPSRSNKTRPAGSV